MATTTTIGRATGSNGTTTPQETGPPPGQRRGEDLLCQWVQGLFLDAYNARQKQMSATEWRDWEKGYWGNYWPEALPSWKSPIQINEMKRLVLTELSDLTDNRPTVYVTPNPRTKQRATNVEYAIQAYWQRQFIDMTILEACLDACIWPCGFLEVIWDPLKMQGQGEIVTRARLPQTVFPDPYATDDEDWRYVITVDVLDVNEVRQRWPDQGPRVRPDVARAADPQPFLMPTERPSGVGFLSPLYPVNTPVPTYGMDTRTTVYTCRVKDSTLEVVPELVKDPEGVEQVRRVTRYKYPQGRLIQCTHDIVLFDGPMPYEDGFDVLRLLLQPAVHHFWPEKSLIGELMELQRAADKMDSLVLENALRMQKAIYLADAHSGIDTRTFADAPGQVVLITPGAKVTPLMPPPLPSEHVQHGSFLRGLMREQVGQPPVRQGQAQRGNVSADLSETEISQAMGLTRLRARFLHRSVEHLVGKILARMGQFYVYPRVLPFMVGDEWQPIEWEPLLDWQQYAAHMDPNSYQVASKTMEKRVALMLARMGRLASDEDLFRILEFPDGQAIAQRNAERLKLQAQAAAQQQGQRGGSQRRR